MNSELREAEKHGDIRRDRLATVGGEGREERHLKLRDKREMRKCWGEHETDEKEAEGGREGTGELDSAFHRDDEKEIENESGKKRGDRVRKMD